MESGNAVVTKLFTRERFQNMASSPVYCICGEPYDSVRFMIQCDACKDWYHGRYVLALCIK